VWAQVDPAALTFTAMLALALWQIRPDSRPTPPPAGVNAGVVSDGTMPRGGVAEYLRDQQETAPPSSRVTARCGMAELYAEREAEARARVARLDHLGGMAELVRHQMYGVAR
jgi:hypothetical protein